MLRCFENLSFCRYDSAQSTVDAIFGQKFHPLFPRQRRSCDHVSGCGSYPTTSHQEYGEGVALVTGDGDQVRGRVWSNLNYLKITGSHSLRPL